jgi:hypothetical protein
MAFSQKESVFVAVTEFLKEKGIEYVPSQPVVLTKEQRKTVIEMVAQAALAGEMSLSADAAEKYDTLEKMQGYCSGLLSNWLAKDTRLNGGNIHQIKNPGSRANQGDAVLKNLKALRTQLTDQTHIEAVDAKIEERTKEIAATKQKANKPIDPNFIPESLRHLLNP